MKKGGEAMHRSSATALSLGLIITVAPSASGTTDSLRQGGVVVRSADGRTFDIARVLSSPTSTSSSADAKVADPRPQLIASASDSDSLTAPTGAGADLEIEVREGDRAALFYLSSHDAAATNEVVLDLDSSTATLDDEGAQPLAVSQAADDASCGAKPATYTASAQTRIVRELFLQYWGWDKARATVAQTTGAYHSLGVKVGSSQSGTAGAKTSTEVGNKTGMSNRRFYNDVRYTRYVRDSCIGGPQVVWKPTGIPRPMAYVGWEKSRPNFRHCWRWPKGKYILKNNENNRKYSTGLTLGGTGLSAEADYTSNVRLYVMSRAKSTVCGDTGEYGEAQRIEMHKAQW